MQVRDRSRIELGYKPPVSPCVNSQICGTRHRDKIGSQENETTVHIKKALSSGFEGTSKRLPGRMQSRVPRYIPSSVLEGR